MRLPTGFVLALLALGLPFGRSAQTKRATSTDVPHSTSRPEDDLAEHIRRMWDNFNSQNIDLIVSQGSHEGIGFGWRTQGWRSSQRSDVPSEDLTKRGAAALRESVERAFASREYYRVNLTDLHTAIDGDIGLAWGNYDEKFKPKNRPGETAHVRFTEAFRRKGNGWQSLLYHRDIQPFDERGRYVPEYTDSGARSIVAAPAPAGTSTDTGAGTSVIPGTKADLARELRQRWAMYSARDVEGMLKVNQGGFGFGWRSFAARSTAWGDVNQGRAGVETYRAAFQRFHDEMESFRAEFEELHTDVDGNVGIAWGIYVEDFKPKGQPAGRARVRYTHVLRHEGTQWRPLLYHHDVQPFDGHGRYLTQFTRDQR